MKHYFQNNCLTHFLEFQLSSINGVTFVSLGCLKFISWSFLYLRCFDVVCCHLQFWDFLLKYNNINLSMKNFHYDKLHQKLFNINIRKKFLKLKIDQLICYFKLHTAERFTNCCSRSFKRGINFEVLNYTDELMFYCPNRFTSHLFSRAFFMALVGTCLQSLESMVKLSNTIMDLEVLCWGDSVYHLWYLEFLSKSFYS